MTDVSHAGLAPQRRLPLPEFIAMLAFLFATIAFSIDAMLPALPDIAADLTPDNVNRAQLILTTFVAGMGLGTLFAGPISDAIGRKRTITIGFGIYIAATIAALYADSLEFLLIARFVQAWAPPARASWAWRWSVTSTKAARWPASAASS